MLISNIIKRQVLDVAPYTLTLHDCPIKLNQNENPYDIPPGIKEEIFDLARDRVWSRYPDFVPDAFHTLLAKHVDWRADGVAAGNGSNELIQAILAVTMEPGASLLVVQPTFTLYKLMGTVLGGTVIEHTLNTDMTFNVEAITRSVEQQSPRIVVICSPNNPTGSVLSLNELAQICDASSGLVVVDQAYVEFGGDSAIPLLNVYDNLVVLRTFSKACGLAGLRVGYSLASAEITEQIAKAKLPYNVDFFSQAAATAVIQWWPRFHKIVDLLISERERVFAEMSQMGGVTVYRSHANFLLFETLSTPEMVFGQFVDRGILIRDVSHYPMLERMLRVTIGTPEQNDAFLDGLSEIVIEEGNAK